MVWLRALGAAFSTYSAIPMPRFRWDDGVSSRVLGLFPAVGAACGLLLTLWYVLCRALGCGGVLFGAVAVCLPLLLTGGIHLDGYMDTVDAISSHQSRERKLEILKDPNCGAFAVIYCAVCLLVSLGLFTELYGLEDPRALLAVGPGYVLSRGLSALCAVTMPSARHAGMLYAYTAPARRRFTLAASGIFALAGCGGMILLSPVPGGCAAALALAWVPAYRALARRLFGGVTGDTAGFFLVLCELMVLLGAWIGSLL